MPGGYNNLNNRELLDAVLALCDEVEHLKKAVEECRNYNGPHLVTHRPDKCAVCGHKVKEQEDATTNPKTS